MQSVERRLQVAESEATGATRYRVLASSPGVARDGFSIPAESWQLEHFRKNPVLTWAHDPALLPLGTVPSVAVTSRGLEAEIEFSPEGVDPFTDQVHALWRLGTLRAVSIGADLLEPPRSVRSGDGSVEHVLDAVSLSHLAVVPVGSDPDALALARAIHCSEETISRLFNQPPTSTTPTTQPADEWLEQAQRRLALLKEKYRGSSH